MARSETCPYIVLWPTIVVSYHVLLNRRNTICTRAVLCSEFHSCSTVCNKILPNSVERVCRLAGYFRATKTMPLIGHYPHVCGMTQNLSQSGSNTIVTIAGKWLLIQQDAMAWIIISQILPYLAPNTNRKFGHILCLSVRVLVPLTRRL